jgi:hypothetical protein
VISGTWRCCSSSRSRSDALHRTHPLRPLLAELDRMEGVTRLELPRLTRLQVGAQLEGILGGPPEPVLARAVHERSDGIPLFTEALLNADGTLRSELPGSLRDLLLGAVKELPEQTQQVLRTRCCVQLPQAASGSATLCCGR